MPDNLPAPVEITTLAARFPIINPETALEIRQVLESNIGPNGISPMQLNRIKVPSGGALTWAVPGLDGEENFKELSGIVLAWTDSRVYYKVPFAERKGKAGPPDCTSKDGFYGVGDPGGECRRCPMAEWGSDPKGGRGQACKQVRRLLFLRADHILPEMVTIPPTSLKGTGEYFRRLTDYRMPYWGLVTNLRLERVSNADGIDFARVVFGGGQRFNEAERAALAPYQAQMQALLHATEIDADYESRDSRDDDDN
jgi:hypothetical protein